MKRLFLVLSVTVVVLPSLAGARVQADPIHWTASGSPLGSAGFQDGSAGGINLGPGNATSGTNSGSVVAIQASPWADPDRMSTPIFGGPSANYSLSLALRDDASGASGSLTFRGGLSGFIGSDNSVLLTNVFLAPTTQTLTLGGNLYTVTIGPFVSPKFLGDEGTVSASIAVHPVVVNSAPEPSSLMLACLGLPSLGLARWFRRRKTVDSNASNA